MKLAASQLRRIIAEEVSLVKTGDKDPQRFLHGYESGHPMDDEGYMIRSRMVDVKEIAETICSLLDDGDQLPAWVQDLVASAHTDLEHVKHYLVGDEKLRAHKGGTTPMGESHRRSLRRLSEGIARITDEELSAWSRGDWGFVSGAESRPAVSEAQKKKGPSKKTAQKILRGTKTFKQKMKKVEKWAEDPAAAAAWMMHKATGKWPSEK
jgi:hypothetical protein